VLVPICPLALFAAVLVEFASCTLLQVGGFIKAPVA